MIGEIASSIFKRIGHTWKSGNKFFIPTEDDVEGVLDQAAATMYDSEPGDRLEIGGLIVEKRAKGFDVYVYVGPYN